MTSSEDLIAAAPPRRAAHRGGIEPRPDFEAEVRVDVRDERGLAVKAAIAVALVIAVVVRTFSPDSPTRDTG